MTLNYVVTFASTHKTFLTSLVDRNIRTSRPTPNKLIQVNTDSFRFVLKLVIICNPAYGRFPMYLVKYSGHIRLLFEY